MWALSRRNFISSLMAKSISSNGLYSSYEDVIKTLHTSLQSNTQKRNATINTKEFGEQQLKIAECYMNKIGIQVTDIDGLSPIHIAGTKGKGSVSALCESILRAKGYKTGFFSSPHLLEDRERIRINGRPISKEMFVRYFWEVFNKLKATESCGGGQEMPFYFLFMCLMSYKVFLQEKVDVAVIEVGIGGSYDSTNIMRHPKVCAITSLGYDHMDMLGSTLPEIAWHKSGIFKPGSPAITVPQPAEALEVIRERAKELGSSSLMVVPNYTSYPNHVTCLGISGDHQLINASLAVQVCKLWLSQVDKENCQFTDVSTLMKNSKSDCNNQPHDSRYECGIPIANPFTLPPAFIKGLQKCNWPGRCQVIKRGGVAYFMDGAHTKESLNCCVRWFTRESAIDIKITSKPLTTLRVLLFAVSGKRDVRSLLQTLTTLSFQYSMFCPYTTIISDDEDSSNPLLTQSRETALLWKRLHEQDGSSSDTTTPTQPLSNEPLVFESISKAVQWIQGLTETGSDVQVLVCGSTFLVGGVMKCLGYNTDTLLQHTEKETE